MPNRYKPLPRKFYLRDTLIVSKELLGKVIVRKIGQKLITAKIVETEAYFGDHDPASHSYQKITERNKIMYDRGGKVYVYFIYGNYYCLNIVSEGKGIGNATLIRAVEPIKGIENMKKYRGIVKNIYELTNGPAKLCIALDVDKKLYGEDVTESKNIIICNPVQKEKSENITVTTKRIGLNVGMDFPYRFFIKDNPFVTKHKYNKESF